MKAQYQQLHDAWKASGLTLAAIVRRSRINIDVPALSRRLSGGTKLGADEAVALSRVLRKWLPETEKAA